MESDRIENYKVGDRKFPLFRGFDGENWKYGSLEVIPDEKVLIKDSSDNRYYEVIPSSVGMFTGLYDKNEQPVFEGDILYINDIMRCPVSWALSDGGFNVDQEFCQEYVSLGSRYNFEKDNN